MSLARIVFVTVVALTLAPVVLAQHARGGHHASYAGMLDRPIKALSEQQLADLRAGCRFA